MSKNKTFFVFYILFVTLFVFGCSNPITEKVQSSYEKEVYPASSVPKTVGISSTIDYRKLFSLPEIGRTLNLVLGEIQISKTTRGQVEQGVCGKLLSYKEIDNDDFSNLGLAAYKDELKPEGWSCHLEDHDAGYFEIYFDYIDITRVIVYHFFDNTFYVEEVLQDLGNPTRVYWSFSPLDTDQSTVNVFLYSYPDKGIEINISPGGGIYSEFDSDITLVTDDCYVSDIILYEPLPNDVFQQVYEKGNFLKVDWKIVPAD